MSNYSVVQHGGKLLAVAQAWVSSDEVPRVITDLFDTVHGWLPRAGVRAGSHVAVYDNFGPGGMRMRAGVEVDRTFSSTSDVTCIELPAGRAAVAMHVGSYTGLHDAQAKLRDWCVGQSLTFDDMAWEIYGDWNDDEARLSTEVFIAVR